MLKVVLKKYQDRLNDLSRRNRAVRLSRIIKKKTFDVGSLSIIEGTLPKKVVESIVNNGPKLLSKYLSYAKAVSEKDEELEQSILDSLTEVKIAPSGLDEYDSDFEGEVRDALVKLGYQVNTQVGCQGYKIDLGILDPKDKQRYIAGIECDGERYHSSRSAKDRDIYRQTILEQSGWKILRVWSRDWWKDSAGETRRLDRELKSVLK